VVYKKQEKMDSLNYFKRISIICFNVNCQRSGISYEKKLFICDIARICSWFRIDNNIEENMKILEDLNMTN